MARKQSSNRNVIRVKHWPEGDLPRDRLLEKGPEALSDAGLLAILLGKGGQGRDTLSLARQVLAQFGGWGGLLSATCQDLMGIKGIGKARASQILAATEMTRRQIREPLQRVNLVKNPNELHQYLHVSMGNLNKEEYRLLYLSPSRHLIEEQVLFKGPAAAATIQSRDVVKSALRKKAAALILAHNCPSGLPKAGEEDFALTRSLMHACSASGILVVDHLIIGQGGVVSMRRRFPNLFEEEDEVA